MLQRHLSPLVLFLAALLALPGAAFCQVDAGAHERLVTEGRALLAEGRAAEAEARFLEAAGLGDGDELDVRMWILRSWMEQGRVNDALDALDELRRAGREGPRMDYLYGMAFARRGDTLISSAVTDGSVQMNYGDAKQRLQRALESGDPRFRDAWLPLARAAWFSKDLAVARHAAEKAVQLERSSGRAWAQLGRVAFSQYALALESEDQRAEAPAHWTRSEAALLRAVDLFSKVPLEGIARRRLAEASLQLGHTYVWENRRSEAAEAYGIAIGEAPGEMNYAQLRSRLFPRLDGNEEPLPGEAAPGVDFNRALEWGYQRLAKRDDVTPDEEGLLLWWLGLSRFHAGRPHQSEAAFLTSVGKAPSFANGWFYVGLIRYEREDWDGAIEALTSGWTTDPSALVAEIRTDPTHLPKVDWLVGHCVQAERYRDAAALTEMCAEATLDDPRHWSNLGLFLRREFEERAKLEEPPTPASQALLGERSLAAYLRALELDAEDPQLINDAAVILDYLLDRDLETALAMYVDAQATAKRRLAAPELSPEDRARFQLAHDDAQKNQVALEERLSGGGAGE